MPLDQKSQEDRPGAFLSLAAQPPCSSSSPLSAYPAANASLGDLVKQEKDVETCLSLQQPSQGALEQQKVVCNEPSQREVRVWPPGPGQHILAYVQEPHTSGQHTAPYLEEPRDRPSQGLDQHTLACRKTSQIPGQHGVCHLKDRDEQTTLPHSPGSGQQILACVQNSQSSKQPSFCSLEEPHGSQAVPLPCHKGQGQYILAYVQEAHTSGKHTAHSLEESELDHKAGAALQKTSPFAEDPQVSEHQTLPQKPSLSLASAEQRKPVSWQGCSQEQSPATLRGLLEQRKSSSCSALSEHQRPASLPKFLELQKVPAFLGFSFQSNLSSVQEFSEQQQQQLGHVVQSNSGSLQEHSSVEAFERPKLPVSQVEEKHLSLQGCQVAVLHRPQSFSSELEAAREGHLLQGPLANQEEQRFLSSQASPGQLAKPTTQGISKEHESTDMQSSILQGSLNYGKGPCLKEHSDESEMLGVLSPKQGSSAQKFYHAQLILPQQGGKVQPSPTVLSANEGVLCSEPIVMSSHTNQADVLDERGHSSPRQSSCLASYGSSEQVYPIPLATHTEVLADQRLFTKTLQSLQAALGLQVSDLQKIGESVLNLHKLYKEVTRRGGLETVIKYKKWNEVIGGFDIPTNVTATASALERIYIDALYHYEQVYFLGACGKIAVPDAHITQAEQETVTILTQDLDALGSRLSTPRGIINAAQVLGVDPASSVGAMVTGAIDGKFENGYLVTVMVGARKLRGVLYHVASTNTLPQNACVPSMMQNMVSDVKSAELVPRAGRKRKKTEVYKKDPNAPRQNRTGYNFFFAEQRAKLKTMQPDKDRVISKMIGELWNKLSGDERTPYQAKGIVDKERYVREMKEYKEKVKLPLIAPNYSKLAPVLSPSTHTPGSMSPQLPWTYMSEAMNGSKFVSSQPPVKAPPAQLPLPCTPEASKTSHPAPLLVDNRKSIDDRNPFVKTRPAAYTVAKLSNTDSKALLPSACISDSLDRSQHASSLLGNVTLSADHNFSVDTVPDTCTTVNRANADVVVDMLDASTVEDTSTVTGMA